MKLEEILPEIRKGRRALYNGDLFCESIMSEILDDEWELEPIKREISREDLANAWQTLVRQYETRPDTFTLNELAEELGL